MCSNHAMGLESGTRLGPYEIDDVLGAGGMGEVYRARDTRLDRMVAIKVLPGHLSDQPQARQRFEREARMISDLNHPNICTLHDIGHDNDIDYLVMELLEGETLADRVERGPIPTDDALALAAQIADALTAAHDKGVIHRDLKPGNIMLTPTGAKLLDFGLARASLAAAQGGKDLTASPTMTSPLTAEGAIIGTFQYMAPEQLEGKEADARSDIFSFGALLYEMLTGQRAFRGESQASLIASILKEHPSVSAVTPSLPASVDRLVGRCMAKDPGERWQTIRDVAIELRWIAENKDAFTPSTTSRSSATNWIPWGIAAAAVTVAALVALRGDGPAPHAASPVRLTIEVPGPTVFGEEFAAYPVISPDGSSVVFGVIEDNGARSLRLRRMDEFTPRRLDGTNAAAYAFWSPESRHVGFFADGKIKRIEIASGSVQTVTESPFARGGSWSRNGKIIFAPNSNSAIQMVDASGGEVTVLTKLDPTIPDGSHRWPCFLPDGTHFLFLLWTNDVAARREHGGVYLASIDGGEPVRILPDAARPVYAPPGYLLVVRGESLVAVPFDADELRVTGDVRVVAAETSFNPGNGYGAFSTSDQGTLTYVQGTSTSPSTLVWYDREGNSTPIDGDPATFFDLRLSPDDSRAVATMQGQDSGTGEIWTINLDRGVRTRLAFGGWYHTDPLWSPEGERVLYTSQENGSLEFYTRRADGTGQQQAFFQTGADKVLYDWSRDGSYVAFSDLERGGASLDVSIYYVDRDEQSPYLEGGSTFTNARFSPDSRWIAYESDVSGETEVFVQSFDETGESARRWQVSTVGGSRPHWRVDGREIVYRSRDNHIVAVSVEPRDGGLVLGDPELLFHIPKFIAALDATSDHQRFLAAVREEADSVPVNVVLNWTADLADR